MILAGDTATGYASLCPIFVLYFHGLTYFSSTSQAGINWRAAVVMIVVLTPLLPGLAQSVSPSTVAIPSGLANLYNINWLYGFHTTIFLYWILSYVRPPRETFVSETIPAFPDESGIIEGIEQRDVSVEKAYPATKEIVSFEDQLDR